MRVSVTMPGVVLALHARDNASDARSIRSSAAGLATQSSTRARTSTELPALVVSAEGAMAPATGLPAVLMITPLAGSAGGISVLLPGMLGPFMPKLPKEGMTSPVPGGNGEVAEACAGARLLFN